MNALRLSANGLALLKLEEGLPGGKPALKPYPDAGGYSIGYGHFILPNEQYLMTGIQETTAETLLRADLAWASRAVNRYVTCSLTQNQFDALVSFVYNIGETAFRKSSLLKYLNQGRLIACAAEFPKWRHSQGVVSVPLVNRRAREKALFEAVVLGGAA